MEKNNKNAGALASSPVKPQDSQDISPDDPRVTPPSFEEMVAGPAAEEIAVAAEVFAPGHSPEEPLQDLPAEVIHGGVKPIPEDDQEAWAEPEKNEYPGP